MSVRKQKEHNVRKLTRLGNESLAVTLPVEIIRKLGWREKQRVKVELEGRHLVIKDWKPIKKRK